MFGWGAIANNARTIDQKYTPNYMRVPPEISYRGINKTDALETLVAEKIAKLERFYSEISSCHLSIEKVHDHPNSGSPYRVRIDITVPEDREIVVDKSPDKGKDMPNQPLEAIIRDAFEVANRQLKEMNEQQHNHMHTQVPGKKEIQLDKLEAEVATDAPAADTTA
ncbi:MAG: HPF/RaiA family ribosome-associated protein [Cyanobacteria bacterium J06588_5]